jgi:hypothetical protein
MAAQATVQAPSSSSSAKKKPSSQAPYTCTALVWVPVQYAYLKLIHGLIQQRF